LLSKWRIDFFSFSFFKRSLVIRVCWHHQLFVVDVESCCLVVICLFFDWRWSIPNQIVDFLFGFWSKKKSKAGARRCPIVSCIIHHSSPYQQQLLDYRDSRPWWISRSKPNFTRWSRNIRKEKRNGRFGPIFIYFFFF
jgi:hypothetical protein